MAQVQQPDPQDPQVQKDPSKWATGDEKMTEPQQSYLETLSRDTGESVDDGLTKAEASEKIDELQKKRDESNTDHQGDGNDIAAETDPDLSRDEAA